MKKGILSVLATMLVALGAQAQLNQHDNYIGLSVEGGMNTLSYGTTNGSRSGGFGLGAQLQYRHFFGRSFGIGIGARYGVAQATATYSFNEATAGLTHPAYAGETYTLHTTYDGWAEQQKATIVSIPIELMHRRALNDDWTMLVGLGAQLDLPQKGHYAATEGILTTTGDFSTSGTVANNAAQGFATRNADIDQEFELKTGLSIIADLGINYAINSTWGLYIGIYGSYGLSNLIDNAEAPMVAIDANNPSQLTYNGTFGSSQTDKVNLLNFGVKLGLNLGWDLGKSRSTTAKKDRSYDKGEYVAYDDNPVLTEEKEKQDRIAREKAAAKQKQAEKKARQEKARQERQEREETQARQRAAAEKAAKERQQQEQKAAEEAKATKQQQAAEKRAAEQRELEQSIEEQRRAEQERIAKERQSEMDAIEQQRLADQQRAEAERKAEQERIEAERKAEQERIEAEHKAEQERIAKEQERIAKEKKAEEERIAREQERIEKEQKAEKERIAKEKERIAKEKKAEEERIAREQELIEKELKAEQERIAKELKAEHERIAKEQKAEQERIEKEQKAEQERIEKELEAERQRLAEQEKIAEQERIAKQKAEQERIAEERESRMQDREDEQDKFAREQRRELERIAQEQKRLELERKAQQDAHITIVDKQEQQQPQPEQKTDNVEQNKPVQPEQESHEADTHEGNTLQQAAQMAEEEAENERRLDAQRMGLPEMKEAYSDIDQAIAEAEEMANECGNEEAMELVADAKAKAIDAKRANDKERYSKAYDLFNEAYAMIADSYSKDADTYAGKWTTAEASSAANDAALYAEAAHRDGLDCAIAASRNARLNAEAANGAAYKTKQVFADPKHADFIANTALTMAENVICEAAVADAKDASGKAYMGNLIESYAASARSFAETAKAIAEQNSGADVKAAADGAQAYANEAVQTARMGDMAGAYRAVRNAQQDVERACTLAGGNNCSGHKAVVHRTYKKAAKINVVPKL